MKYIKAVNNLLFPTKNLCYFCRGHYDYIENYICSTCKDLIEIEDREIIMDSPYINQSYYSVSYNRFIRKQLVDFKFHGKSYLYKPLASIMLNTIEVNNLYDVDLIMYIPSHFRKEAIRGYNQSELLARYIGKSINRPISHNNLIKIRATKDQRTLDRYARGKNLENAFKIINNEEVMKRRILIVDDITTTGSTIKECAKILMENGAGEVLGLTLSSTKN